MVVLKEVKKYYELSGSMLECLFCKWCFKDFFFGKKMVGKIWIVLMENKLW